MTLLLALIVKGSAAAGSLITDLLQNFDSAVSKSDSASLQFESVEHLQADVPDVLFIFTVSRHFLQDSPDGIKNLLSILKICSTAVQNP